MYLIEQTQVIHKMISRKSKAWRCRMRMKTHREVDGCMGGAMVEMTGLSPKCDCVHIRKTIFHLKIK